MTQTVPDEVERSREKVQVRLSRRRVASHAASLDQEARDLAAAALAKSEAHENLCNERWGHQKDAMTRMETSMDAIKKAMEDKIGKLPAGIIAALTGLVGFLGARAFPH